jgi:rod shape determining protein RodA
MVRKGENILINTDWFTVILYLLLIIYGWLSIYSASFDDPNAPMFDLNERYGKQILWIALAVVLAISIMIIDAKFFNAFAYWIYFGILLLLIAVLLFGKTVAGSKSWIQIGSFAIQPAEFAKFATALALAKFLSRLNININDIKTKLLAVGIIALPSVLILLQNDTGSALVYFSFILVLYREGFSGLFLVVGLIMALLFILTLLYGKIYLIAAMLIITIAGLLMSKKYFRRNYKTVLGILLLASIYVYSVNYAFENVLQTHQRNRIKVILGMMHDPKGVGYNVNQSKIAIGSGGLYGKGFKNGMLTRYHYVPEQSTDFIFCTVGEERGFVGSVVLIALFLTLLIRLIVLAERQRSHFSRIYGYGVASILFFHFAVNIAMTMGLMPVVGIPLPFFSYGGSSLWAFTILLFIFIKQDANRLNVL